LDGAEKVKLYWNVNHDESSVKFALRVQATGWVGFGISAGTGNMVGSDVVMGWVKDGKGYLQDRYADSKSLPSLDSSQDWHLLESSEENGFTTLSFHRKFYTCDTKDNKIEDGSVRVVYSYHDTKDPDISDDSTFLYHSARGSRTLILLNVHKKKPQLPAQLSHFDLRHNLTIPSRLTSYMCKPFEFPQPASKHHIVKYMPLINSKNLGRVHHMLVYGCHSSFPRSNLSHVGECTDKNMPPAIQRCSGAAPIAAWAIGGEDFYYPEHVGLAFGDGHGPRYVVLEIHYDNPQNDLGVYDDSGIRFFFTNKTRQFDAGILWAGWAPISAMVIPPRQEEWTSIGYCPSNCTRLSSLPDKGINIFAGMEHTHLQGIKVWTRHVRDGKELPEIIREEHYDFNYQEFQVLRNEVHVKPGDDIIQMCKYQTKNKNYPVVGGLGTTEEMCMSFLLYYPQVDLAKC
ncbi:predicted protein, partial [Nematostella vectensis]